ncbi:hypothetical protein E1293_41620 [Actinomadura darangshiensis]|uniref:Uncharacterized protein n=1 Tax=Actinomadura darangshiensis TaxID=705336 RepID=A0A4R4ZYJ3_9ACTN|nr:hypothetical protein [Actinomadura darangshiensis]TDD64341.1 hypothetical protein E1293_41620 [Actinomadura darangshiensis]
MKLLPHVRDPDDQEAHTARPDLAGPSGVAEDHHMRARRRLRRRSRNSDVLAQQPAVRVLADVLPLDLPLASWTVHPWGPVCLTGHVGPPGADTPDKIGAAYDAIEQWARFLRVDVVARPYAPGETIHLQARGTHGGVEIHMLAVVPDDGGAWRHRRER